MFPETEDCANNRTVSTLNSVHRIVKLPIERNLYSAYASPEPEFRTADDADFPDSKRTPWGPQSLPPGWYETFPHLGTGFLSLHNPANRSLPPGGANVGTGNAVNGGYGLH